MSKSLGKIDPILFKQYIFNHLGTARTEVRTGAQYGVDVSIIDLPGNHAIALTSDPLSLIPTLGLRESAWLSIQLLVNDIATTGFPPMYGQFVLNLPDKFSKQDFRTYWDYMHRYCDQYGICITGGHTGFIEGQHSTIAGGGTLLTVAPGREMLTSNQAQAGDAILVTKTCALSSSAILALSFPETVKNKLGTEIYQEAADTFYHTSVFKEAMILGGNNNQPQIITAMHDVTEGGVLGAIHEVAIASGNGACIFKEKLPVGHAQRTVCALFQLDPHYCIGAGSMIITCKKEKAEAIILQLARQQISCVQVGELTHQDNGIKLIGGKNKTDLIYRPEDPYWGAFLMACKKGWK
jgi:hydrogenase maturation factor